MWLFAAAVLVLHVIAIRFVGSGNGFWNDEYYSIYASDPTLPLSAIMGPRILADSNPPIYFTLLYVVRQLPIGIREAMYVLNYAVLLVAAAAVLLDAWKTGRRWLGLFVVAGFLLSGTTLCFIAEGRAYLSAQAVVLVAAWLAMRSLFVPTPWTVRAVVLGALAAGLHLFAAIACGTLAAAGLAYRIIRGDRNLPTLSYLALGASASIVTVVWYLSLSGETMYRVGWIEFTPESVKFEIRSWLHLAFGGVRGMLFSAACIGGLLLIPRSRPYVLFGAVALGGLVAIPMVISLVQPLIIARYFSVAEPILVATLVVAASRLDDLFQRVTVALLVAGMLASTIPAARQWVKDKQVFAGAPVVSTLAATCGPGSIRVNLDMREEPFRYDFHLASGLPLDTFVNAAEPLTGTPPCPIIGWSEHDGFDWEDLDGYVRETFKLELPPDRYRIETYGQRSLVVISNELAPPP